MILKSCLCPGPQWCLLPVGFVVSGSTGERITLGASEHFWIYEPSC